ncbi:MAG: TAXI family TRAP transporter solute-binding subunit [Pedosphaera sp.]|nr:TAXI family TRAP transporter solute-binding subunit [Pedosphaera sp.]|tara:strand:+ start:678 stop:2084 length:1407 start_codon:yes stop_codon:yes gene_type:complete
MNRKWITVCLLGLLICIPLSQLVIGMVGMNRTIIIAGGPEQGLYRPLALSLQKALTRLGRKSEVRTTEGTLENLKLVAEGKADFALFQPGAYEGLKRFEPELLQGESRKIDAAGLEQVTFVANLYSQPLHIAVREGSGIESLMDFKGKRVNLGVKLSGDYPMARMLMETLEIGVGELHTNLTYTGLVEAFERGELDAAVITVGMQANVFRALAKSGKIRFLSIPNHEALAAMELHLTPFSVPRGVYQFEGNPVPRDTIQTVATGAHLITSSELEGGLVERVTEEVLSSTFQRENKLQELFEQGKSFANSKPFFPVHEGARWVYEPESRTLLDPDIIEMWENMRSFIVSFLAAGFFGYQWFRKRQERLKDNKIDEYVRRVIDIERQQMNLDAGGGIEDLDKLQVLQDQLTELRQECFKDFSGHNIQDEPGTDCFLELCASLSEKLNSKMTRLRLGGDIQRLAKAIEGEK